MPASQKKFVLLIFFTIIALLVCPVLILAQSDHRGLDVVAAPIAGSEPIGQQYAVFIAIDRYKEWPPLKNAVSDAERIRSVLQKRYYIDQTYTLYDDQATKEKVMKLFENLSNELRPEDSLFVFYAGHGVMDPLTKIGSWILQDGGTNRYEQKGWLDNPKIRSLLSAVRSKHVLLVSDSCFSGDILNVERGSQIEIADEYFKKAYARRSRQVLTSGASETVPDQSVFTRSLIRLFEENSKPYLDPLMLFNEIRLTKDLTTSPLLGTLRDTDSQEGGSFIFFLKQSQPVQVAVQYDPNGATAGAVPVDSGLYSPGAITKVLSPGSLSKSGYEFAAWNTMPDGSGTDVPAGSFLTMKDANITLYARWVPESKYRILYSGNGSTSGAAPFDAVLYKAGEKVTIFGPGNLSKSGYEFAAWNTMPDGSGTDVP
ncbi:MAG: InlB B-repeat-containing protein, partial [Rectinema subterraneum]|uniref:InlB B-repeat-containing protein n=1 Tax=Rectinema subterraneum TaxID=2653714 RepID=UPI003C7E51FF